MAYIRFKEFFRGNLELSPKLKPLYSIAALRYGAAMNLRCVYFYSAFMIICSTAFSAVAQDFSISQLTDYYSNLPGQYIKPNMNNIQQSLHSTFFLNRENAYTPIGEKRFNAEFTQDLFQIDSAQFIKTMNATDFLDAKVKFYSQLYFYNKTQKHEAPYRYMSGWLSLNHPPVKKIELPLGAYTQHFSKTTPRPETSAYFSPEFQIKLDAETDTELTFGNKLKTLFNGNSIKEKVRLVKDAKRYVFGAVMATICDPSSEEFVQALIDKAQSGIPVTLMMERFYMHALYRSCANRLRKGGVDVVLINDKWKLKTFLTFFHAKFWIRDGEEVIVGGQNIVEYENNSTGYNQLNRDTDLLIQGPAVTDFLAEYLTLWNEHGKRKNQSLESYRVEMEQAKEAQRMARVRGNQFYEEQLANPKTRMQGTCRVMVQGPHNRNLSIASVLRRYAEEAQKSIILTSPELEFDLKKQKLNQRDQLFQTLRNAATSRGVNIELILNGVDGGNGELTAGMREAMIKAAENGKNLRYQLWKMLLNVEPQSNARGHREYLHALQTTPGFRTWTHFNYMHAKQAYFDRIATSITSVNLDKASLERNYEAGAICLDEDLSRQMENQLTLDLVNSTPVVSLNESPELSSPSLE